MINLTTLLAQGVRQTIGEIEAPPGVDKQIAHSGLASNQIALLFFVNKLITILTVVLGIWVALNLMLAAFDYLTGQGKADAHQKVRDRITMSAFGLLLLVVAYLATALIGLLFFGDAAYILKPVIQGPL